MDENGHKQHAVSFLLEEYKYLADSFWKNEETGEKRVNFFITLVTAVIAALVTLATSGNDYLQENIICLITIFSLVALLSFGIFTLLRMIRRNKVTDEYKKAMDKIRDIFRTIDNGLLKRYYPFGKDRKPRKLGRGGLAETVALINSLIVAALVALLWYDYQKWIFVVYSFIGFGFSLTIQFLILKYYYAKFKAQLEEIESKGN